MIKKIKLLLFLKVLPVKQNPLKNKASIQNNSSCAFMLSLFMLSFFEIASF